METPVPFDDIELNPRESDILLDLLDNRIDIAPARTGQRMIGKLKDAMPDATWHRLLAQEFMRQQEKILVEQVMARIAAAPLVASADTELTEALARIDARIDEKISFFVKPLAMRKSAGG